MPSNDTRNGILTYRLKYSLYARDILLTRPHICRLSFVERPSVCDKYFPNMLIVDSRTATVQSDGLVTSVAMHKIPTLACVINKRMCESNMSVMSTKNAHLFPKMKWYAFIFYSLIRPSVRRMAACSHSWHSQYAWSGPNTEHSIRECSLIIHRFQCGRYYVGPVRCTGPGK